MNSDSVLQYAEPVAFRYSTKTMPFHTTLHTPRSPADFLATNTNIFATFDHRTQDSGNISYGVEIDGERYFAKTTGLVDDDSPYLDHASRVQLLRNAARLADSCDHHTLPPLRQVIESSDGPMLFYDWVEGELVRNALQKIRRLPVSQILDLLNNIYDLHVELIKRGWIANDFYDGSMIYDFHRRKLHAVDLDTYHRGPFTNRMGRVFGSTRFMAPEEFELGATIDERTTVFTLGRTAAVLLSDNSLDRKPFRGSDAQYEIILRACNEIPDTRFQTVAQFRDAWLKSGFS